MSNPMSKYAVPFAPTLSNPISTNMGLQSYDAGNVFARILRKEIDCKMVLETPHTLAFHDAFPVAPVHVLIIPKGAYITADDFFGGASAQELLDWAKAIADVIQILGIKEPGYRLVANAGHNGGQVVPHFHMHILGGRALQALG